MKLYWNHTIVAGGTAPPGGRGRTNKNKVAPQPNPRRSPILPHAHQGAVRGYWGACDAPGMSAVEDAYFQQNVTFCSVNGKQPILSKRPMYKWSSAESTAICWQYADGGTSTTASFDRIDRNLSKEATDYHEFLRQNRLQSAGMRYVQRRS